MDGIIHLTETGRVDWIVRIQHEVFLVVSVDFRASQNFGKENSFCSLYMGPLVSEELLQAFCHSFSPN